MKDQPTYTKQTIGLYLQSARRYPHLLWPLVIILPIVVLGGNFLLPYLTSQVLDRLSTGHFDPAHVWDSFAPTLMLFAIVSVLCGIIGWRIIAWLNWRLELDVQRDLLQRIFNHLMTMSANFHANRFGGSLVSQANKLAGSYIRFADSTTFNLYPLAISIIATIVILAPKAPLYVAVLISLAIIYMIGIVLVSRKVREANAAESTLQSKQTGYLADAIANVFAVKTFSAVKSENQRFARVTEDVRQAGRASMTATLARQNYASIMVQAMFISALFIAVIGIGVLHGSIGTVFLIVSYTGNLAERLWEFQNILRQYNRALGDARDMVEIFQIQPEIQDPVKPERSRMQSGAIRFDHMTFTHAEADETLFQDFNLDIAPGEKIGLVGRSGSGKTTLTRLLLRFSDLDGGIITIDGQDITKVTQDDLRRAISYVPQEPLLFHRTLSENIAYGKPKATKLEIAAAARRSHAAEFIDKLPQGYETLVGERGVKLSGGQRQRVAIARAMLKDAPILVLDEATSALDSESEKLIQDALWRLMEGRTAIVIAHRLSTIQRMDRIVVLDNGAIVEQGTHKELLAAKGTYAKLWSHQSGGFMGED